MYDLRPIISFDRPIEIPVCMYKQRNFHANGGNEFEEKISCTYNSGTFKQNIESGEMAKLEMHQKKLLSQIEELKKMLNDIKSQLKSPDKINTSRKKEIKVESELKIDDSADIIINANPSYPPYFLLFIQKLLKGEVNLNLTSHVHSSVAKLPKKTEIFVENLKKYQVNESPSMNVRLIWKEIEPNAEVYVSHYPIKGDANVLRYLARNLNKFTTNTDMEKVDFFLDLSYRFSNTRSKTVQNNLLQTLNNSLKDSKWLSSQNTISIADIGVYDCLKKFANAKDITGKLLEWFNQCENYVK